MRGYVIYPQRAQPEVNESHLYKVPKNKELIFHMGEVSELWRKTVVNNSHIFNLRNCSVVFKCNNSFGKINLTLLK